MTKFWFLQKLRYWALLNQSVWMWKPYTAIRYPCLTKSFLWLQTIFLLTKTTSLPCLFSFLNFYLIWSLASSLVTIFEINVIRNCLRSWLSFGDSVSPLTLTGLRTRTLGHLEIIFGERVLWDIWKLFFENNFETFGNFFWEQELWNFLVHFDIVSTPR